MFPATWQNLKHLYRGNLAVENILNHPQYEVSSCVYCNKLQRAIFNIWLLVACVAERTRLLKFE